MSAYRELTEAEKRERAIEYLEHYKKVKYGMMPEWVWDMAIKALEQEPKSPCDLCKYNPPGSGDGKPCTMCPAESEG